MSTLREEFCLFIDQWQRSDGFTTAEASLSLNIGMSCVFLNQLLSDAARNGWTHNDLRVERCGRRGNRTLWRVATLPNLSPGPELEKPAPSLVPFDCPIARWMLDRWKAGGEKPLTVRAAIAHGPTTYTAVHIGNVLKSRRGWLLVDGYRLTVAPTKARGHISQWCFVPEPAT